MKRTMHWILPLILLIWGCGEKTPESTADYTVANDVLWASPKGFDLTMDIYTPSTGKSSYPVIVMFHGGGWLINNKSIMHEAAQYLARDGNYVVCNVNYRLLVDLENTVSMDEIIEDAMGAVLWIKANIGDYQGDPQRIIVTGDSAGGHLAMMIVLAGNQLHAEGFDGIPLAFAPSWLPEGMTPQEVAARGGLDVQAAMISYGAFDLYAAARGGFESDDNVFWSLAREDARGIFGANYNIEDHPAFYRSVSPAYLIPDTADQILPPLLFTVGSEDELTTPASIEAFIDDLNSAGHMNTTYWVHEGRPHAFLDAGRNIFLGINFEDDAPPALEKMLEFLDDTFYP